MYSSILLNQFLNRLVNKVLGQHVTIFTLHRAVGEHGLTGTAPDLLRTFLESLIKAGVAFISIDDLIKRRSTLPTDQVFVCFTIDDGYADQVTELVPILLEYHVQPTLFIITSLVDTGILPWDARIAAAVKASTLETFALSDLGVPGGNQKPYTDKRLFRRQISEYAKKLQPQQREDFVQRCVTRLSSDADCQEQVNKGYKPTSWQALQALEKSGLNIGSHTHSHQPLSTLGESQIESEMTVAKGLIEKYFASPSKTICYPVGMAEDFDQRCQTIAQNLGYHGGVTAISGYTTVKTLNENPFTIPRFSFPTDMQNACRYVSWLEKLRPSNKID
ncbi:polysaccharide deacetylase family protein [Alteromonas sp. ASW11-36]|uniref:Polysaccharide deacetylase family protein n=1 Tax=Alteromonas arenosi TaxID=3055817 RepID=A0ABT7STV3_9ALTE|nr:polysaccharide deacetylase family protein [Alteromonas sp. ASW11-36]MDM7859623.1 polysaccharide deacetylase family protein [Alteromonas sp. ASW11-36]